MPDEDALLDIADLVCRAAVPYAMMVEPDLDDEHTSIAIAPSSLAPALATLPLHGREMVTA